MQANKDLTISSERVSAFKIELPLEVERETLAFMRDGIGMTGSFTAAMIREGVMDEMKRRGHDLDALPKNWSRRVVDALLLREKQAGRIEIFGAPKGPRVIWRCVWQN